MNQAKELYNTAYDLQTEKSKITNDMVENLQISYLIYDYIVKNYDKTIEKEQSIKKIEELIKQNISLDIVKDDTRFIAENMIESIVKSSFGLDVSNDSSNDHNNAINSDTQSSNTSSDIRYHRIIMNCGDTIFVISIISAIITFIYGIILSSKLTGILMIPYILLSLLILFGGYVIRVLIVGFSIVVRNSEEAIKERKNR